MKKILVILLSLIFAVCTIQVSGQSEETFDIVDAYCSELSTAEAVDSYDGSFATGWGGNGVVDIWVVWELEKIETLPGISIAFARGNERQAKFDIQISEDGETFVNVLTDVLSSGDTLDYEFFAFPDSVKAKYVKYIGYGNTSSLWTNVTEVKFLKKSPELQNTESAGGVQIVSKADYVCENSMIFQSGNPNALFMGDSIWITNPVVDNGRMMVPLRVIVEKQGGKILWDEMERSASCVVGNTVIKFKADSSEITVNGKEQLMDVDASIINGVFMAPVKVLADNFGKYLMWDGTYNIVFMSENVIPELNKWELADINERITNTEK